MTFDIIILGINHFLHSSFIPPGVRQKCTSPKSAQSVDVMAMQVKLNCKRTEQRAKGKSREQEPAIVEQRPEIKGQRAKSREHIIMHTGQVFAQSRSLIAHPSIRAQAPRCEQNWILGGRGDTCTVQGKWLVSVVNRINQIGAISLMASPQDLETWLDSVTQYVCHFSGVR